MLAPTSNRDMDGEIAAKDKPLDKAGDDSSIRIVTENNKNPSGAEDTEANEVFKLNGQVNYRTMGWIKASIMFCKFQIAAGILSIPGSFHDLGAIPASILVFVWGGLSLYGALLMGQFRLNHASIHSVGDAGTLIGGKILGEVVAWMYFFSWVLPAGVTMLSVSIAFNTLSDHALCTMTFTAIAAVLCTIPALMPKFGQIGVLTWVGFVTLYISILIVVIAVSLQDRPAAAPTTGTYDLEFYLVNKPTFSVGLAASNLILTSYGGTTAYIPASSEMRDPKRYFNRAVYIALTITTLSYFILPLIVYKYCGQYVASPALASAGPLIKKIAYGIALPGLAITCTLFLHTCGKFIMVKLLRGTRHLQEKTWQHRLTWLCSVVSITIVAFVLATGVPFYSELLSVLVLFTTPNTISLPMLMWFYDNKHFKRKTTWYASVIHGIFLVAGLFFGIAGCIVSCLNINDLYKEGKAGAAFSCADNAV
ncbi:hypothetical protein PFICI_11144 [Pestalotiopsis fici W106-1]|uniref:Amino acid transporter transmembrane domain-containing protein n=1 Tax=Pestalotiopsis fici (strain W106-1 / CGMCC3.15140) TaxID=1229662 RepID=W3WTU3_PESFW|nr:uncharacterized protein PFICI_11144 [Pestalotiopsis fici W106-1]ETS77270.1 hypothetical protein PFICI_11144 [Pestalotiopsis fici W106-1]